VLLRGDAVRAAANLAGGRAECPCGRGRLAPWDYALERPVRLLEGSQARVRPARVRCRACLVTHVLLSAWCLWHRGHRHAAGAALDGTGHWVIGGRLGVPADTVRGCLRLRAEPLRCHAIAPARQLRPPGSTALAGCPAPSALPWRRWLPSCAPPSAAWATARIDVVFSLPIPGRVIGIPGANAGANGGRHPATSGHGQWQYSQLDGISGYIQRLAATL
jgi:hypothetical protein